MEQKIVKCPNCPATATVTADGYDKNYQQTCSEIRERLIIHGAQSGEMGCRYIDPLIHAAVKKLMREAKHG